MSIMDKLRGLFEDRKVPEETRQLYASAANSRDLVKGLETFLMDQQLDRESAEAAIETSGGRFQILEHKGKSYIQRSSR